MNPSFAPASNETVAYGSLLAQASKLKRSDQVNLVKALAGMNGMVAVFPNQLVAGNSPSGAKAPKEKKGKGPAKQVPSNPLSGSPEKRAFDTAKKAVAKATKEAGGAKLPSDHGLVKALENAKDQYFRALSGTKSTPSAPAAKPVAPQAKPAASVTPPKAASPQSAPKAQTPPKK